MTETFTKSPADGAGGTAFPGGYSTITYGPTISGPNTVIATSSLSIYGDYASGTILYTQQSDQNFTYLDLGPVQGSTFTYGQYYYNGSTINGEPITTEMNTQAGLINVVNGNLLI